MSYWEVIDRSKQEADQMMAVGLIIFLYKLQVGGLRKESISALSHMLTGGPGPNIPRLAFRMAIVNTSIDYLIGTTYAKHDSNIPMGSL
jgi:hypothetical protein